MADITIRFKAVFAMSTKKWKVVIVSSRDGMTTHQIAWGNLTRKLTVEHIEHDTDYVYMANCPRNWFLT